jgi:hypothetical protein
MSKLIQQTRELEMKTTKCETDETEEITGGEDGTVVGTLYPVAPPEPKIDRDWVKRALSRIASQEKNNVQPKKWKKY